MKMVYCKRCDSIVRLVEDKERLCECGECGGRYLDQINAYYFGKDSIPLGFDNHSFLKALNTKLKPNGWGQHFEAFKIPTICNTMKKITKS